MRSQANVIRELLGFMIGVGIMVFFINMFNSTINPKISDYSLNEEALTVIKQLNALISRTATLSSKLKGNVTMINTMPLKVVNEQYRIYTNSNQLCIKTAGKKIITKCVNSTITMSGNYLSGTNIKITASSSEAVFNNEIPLYEKVLFLKNCDKEVVDWNDYYLFSRSDDLTCGCDEQLDNNKISNNGFEQGLDNWIVMKDDANSIVSVSTTNTIEGSNSLYIEGVTSDPGSKTRVIKQLINFNGEINISVYSTNTSSGASYISANIKTVNHEIIYMFYVTGGLDAYCNNYYPGDDNTYIKCLHQPVNQWNTITLNPANDFNNIFKEELRNKTVYLKLLIGGQNKAYFDNIKNFITSSGLYCDTTNSGLANGACYNNTCSDFYLGMLVKDYFFPSSEANIKFQTKNLNSQQCTLRFNNNDYEMIDKETESYYNLGRVTKGDYTINASCGNQSAELNISVDVLHKTSEIIGINIGETTSLSAGKLAGRNVIAVINNSNPSSVSIYDINTTLIKSISFDNNENATDIMINDIDYDNEDELVIRTNNYLKLYNNNLSLRWSVNIPAAGIHNGRLAITDLISDEGKEVIDQQEEIRLINSTGSIKWFKQSIYTNSYFNPEFTPAIADVNNDGAKEVIGIENDNLSVMNNNRITLYTASVKPMNDLFITPAVGELNNSDGLEIVYVTNSTPTMLSAYLFNSTMGVIWKYDIGYWDSNNNHEADNNDLLPKSVIIGDVTGDKVNDIIISLVNRTNFDANEENDKIIILSNNGSLINTITIASHLGAMPALAEIDPSNPGYEILIQANNLLVMNSTSTIKTITEGPFIGTRLLIKDINDDGYNEIVTANSYDDSLFIIKSSINSTSNEWTAIKGSYEQTGYKDSLPDMDYSESVCESYGYEWVNNECCGDDWLNDNYDGCVNGQRNI